MEIPVRNFLFLIHFKQFFNITVQCGTDPFQNRDIYPGNLIIAVTIKLSPLQTSQLTEFVFTHIFFFY